MFMIIIIGLAGVSAVDDIGGPGAGPSSSCLQRRCRRNWRVKSAESCLPQRWRPTGPSPAVTAAGAGREQERRVNRRGRVEEIVVVHFLSNFDRIFEIKKTSKRQILVSLNLPSEFGRLAAC